MKMTYEEFKEMVISRIKEYLPEQYKEARIVIRSVMKVNCILDGLTLEGMPGTMASPAIYMNEIYAHYLQTGDCQEALQSVARSIEIAMDKVHTVAMIDFNNAKDKVIFQLVNTEQNKEMFEAGVPHREFQDLSIIYRYIVKIDEEEIQSAIVNKSLADKLGMSEEQLFKAATKNTRRLLPPTVKSIRDIACEMMGKDIGCPKAVNIMLNMMQQEEPAIWIISNNHGINGAASMLYDDKLQEVAEKIGNDFYILPSSTHEVIAISADIGDPYELAQMVAETNMRQVTLNERLSNQVYYYDRNLRKISLATDTPNKRLDEIKA